MNLLKYSHLFHNYNNTTHLFVLLIVGRSGPYEHISIQKPPTRLLRAPNMFSLVMHIIILAISQVVVVFIVQSQEW